MLWPLRLTVLPFPYPKSHEIINLVEGTEKKIYSVSEITSSIKSLLEKRFSFVWVSGEISNFRIPASGHFYFTLKDARSQISAVMFRGQNRNLNFDIEDGQHLIGLGRISVYEPRGTYQIIFEYIEPKGVGALQIAFEQLKKRLFEEGLFGEEHKQALPFLPKKISIITSPTGAVIHDIIHVIYRRYPTMRLEILPVKVQGEGSVEDIISALATLNERMDTDLIIVARGGGSLEDLQAFNSEKIARAIFNSEIPVISAVGHEIDYTISDFVADLRAPTPSAAAELAVPLKNDLTLKLLNLEYTLKSSINLYLQHKKDKMHELSIRLRDPKKRIQDLHLKLDDLISRLIRLIFSIIDRKRDRIDWRTKALITYNPNKLLIIYKEKLDKININLLKIMLNIIQQKRSQFRESTTQLVMLDPKAILKRGYSITRTIPESRVVHDPETVSFQQELEILVEKGVLICKVERKLFHGKKII